METGQIIHGIIILILIWAFFIEKNLLVTSRYKIESDRLPKAFHNTNFVVLADLHNNSFGKNNARLVKRIEALAPDFIIVAGDMINKKSPCYPSNAYKLLDELSKRYKVYYAYGNHEQRMEECKNEHPEEKEEQYYFSWLEYKKNLQDKGVVFLDNKTIALKKSKDTLLLTGLSIDRCFFERYKLPKMEEKYVNSLIGTKEKSKYQILIAHSPVYFKEYINWGADLTISGHIHGGMVRLPGIGGLISPQVKLFPKYQAGKYTENGKQMVVSRGLGSHSSMPRLFNAPEIVNITMKYKA